MVQTFSKPLTPPGVVGADCLNPYSSAPIDGNGPMSVIVSHHSTVFIPSMIFFERSHRLIMLLLRAVRRWLVICILHLLAINDFARYVLSGLSQVPTIRHHRDLSNTFKRRFSRF